jgi:uncharacterized protein
MSSELAVLIQYRMERAVETFEDAKLLLHSGSLFSTVNRIYYALFYAVSALLLTKELSAPKHSGVLGIFNREFVHAGLVSKEAGRFYNEMFAFRQKADYKDMVKFEIADVEKWLEQAQTCLSELRRVIEKSGGGF